MVFFAQLFGAMKYVLLILFDMVFWGKAFEVKALKGKTCDNDCVHQPSFPSSCRRMQELYHPFHLMI